MEPNWLLWHTTGFWTLDDLEDYIVNGSLFNTLLQNKDSDKTITFRKLGVTHE